MFYKLFITSMLALTAISTSAKTTRLPQAYSTIPDELTILDKLAKFDEQRKTFDEWEMSDLTHTWQLYLTTTSKYQLTGTPSSYFEPPISLTFSDNQFVIKQGCQYISGDYRPLATEAGMLAIENISNKINHCKISDNAIQTIIGFDTLNDFDFVTIEIIPIQLNDKKEKILKISHEFLGGDKYNVFVFRKSPF